MKEDAVDALTATQCLFDGVGKRMRPSNAIKIFKKWMEIEETWDEKE